ncbi:MAG: winged helix-turn-helix domain-containing protein [Chloracidobacterium sp.]|nr:winged helix-turn-helix domain-containing protein [Chloracidobacterium sp.]
MSRKYQHFYEFDEFRLYVERPSLVRNGVPVSIPPKALEVLSLLVSSGGEVVSRAEILESVWSDTFVEESNINYTISLLRKILGSNDHIATVPKRGYRFNTPAILVKDDEQLITDRSTSENAVPTPLPAPIAPRKRSSIVWPLVIGSVLIIMVLVLVLYKGQNVARDVGGGDAKGEIKFQKLTDTGDVAYLVISPNGEYSAHARSSDLYLKDLRSGGEIRVETGDQGKIGCLQFSADNANIFFGSYLENASGKISQVPRMGGSAKLVAENVWSGFSLSPDGNFLAFTRKFPAENRTVVIVKDLLNGSEIALAERTLPEQYYWNNYPAWSPDGKKLALVVDTYTEHFVRITIIDIASGSEEQISVPSFRNVEQIVWARDQRSFIAAASAGESFQLWRIATPSGEVSAITNDLDSYLGISTTLDGTQLVARRRTYYSNIWVASQENLDDLRQLTVGSSKNDGLKGLSWLDDDRIVYSSNAEGLRDWNLWTVHYKDRSRRQITFDKTVQNDFPSASGLSDVTYFSSNRNDDTQIWQVNAAGENLKQVTDAATEAAFFPQVTSDEKAMYFLRKKIGSTVIAKRDLADGRDVALSSTPIYAPDNFLALSPDDRNLAFQILANKNDPELRAGKIKIGVIDTSDTSLVKTFVLPVASEFFTWRLGENAFDYVVHTPEGARIMRQKLDPKAEPVVVLKLPKDDIFGLAWSRDGQKLAISRGQLLRDVVLLTNFASH